VDSQSLNFLLTELRAEFLEIGRACASVIVCRAEPLQKAQVVALMKKVFFVFVVVVFLFLFFLEFVLVLEFWIWISFACG
jgi:magnesium-transporting ATPase (P-type)